MRKPRKVAAKVSRVGEDRHSFPSDVAYSMLRVTRHLIKWTSFLRSSDPMPALVLCSMAAAGDDFDCTARDPPVLCRRYAIATLLPPRRRLR